MISLKTEYRRGRPERSWERRRADEAWDCAVQALATIHGLADHGVSLDMEAGRLTPLRKNVQPSTANGYAVYRAGFLQV